MFDQKRLAKDTMASRIVLAAEFSRVLREHVSQVHFGPGESEDRWKDLLKATVRLAAEGDDACCASHDFVDSNMSMDEAHVNVFGYSPLDVEDEDPAHDDRFNVMNAAWDVAKASLFDWQLIHRSLSVDDLKCADRRVLFAWLRMGDPNGDYENADGVMENTVDRWDMDDDALRRFVANEITGVGNNGC